jgi:serine/threonine protein kinase
VLEALDEARGTARMRSTTPFDRTMERGVLLGGIGLAGDLPHVLVDNAADPSVFEVVFDRDPPRAREREQARREAFWRATNDALADEVQRRAAEVEALSARLRAQVVDRSRDLSVALRRIASPDARHELTAGQVIRGYARIVRMLGRGGMGEVYLADCLTTGQAIAVKLLRPELGAKHDMVQRFLAEAAAAATVNHPGIVRTLHVDVTDDGRVFQILEYVDGVTLRAYLHARPMTPPLAVSAALGVARPLAAAHALGVVHRDISPNNLILVDAEPGIRILDFGLSKFLGRAGDPASGHTRAGYLLGTPAYMSPEQVRDASTAGAAADIYSQGVVLYEVIAGALPFTSDSPAGLLLAHLGEAPRPLPSACPAAPAAVASLVHRCLAKDPDERPTAAALVDELAALAVELRAPPLTGLSRSIEQTSVDAAHQSTAMDSDLTRR